jgi:hypothetical protein
MIHLGRDKPNRMKFFFIYPPPPWAPQELTPTCTFANCPVLVVPHTRPLISRLWTLVSRPSHGYKKDYIIKGGGGGGGTAGRGRNKKQGGPARGGGGGAGAGGGGDGGAGGRRRSVKGWGRARRREWWVLVCGA